MTSSPAAILERLTSPVGSITRVSHLEDGVILTFDDGPRHSETGRILRVLDSFGATATFFVLLNRARALPDMIGAIVEAGHEVALHGTDHRPLPSYSPAENRVRLRTARTELEDITERQVRWMRPPYGRQRVQDWLAIRSAGMESVMWNRTNWDSRDVPMSHRFDRAVNGVRAGDILLAHDGFADEEDGVDDGPEPVLDRAELLTLVLERYREVGLRGMSLERSLDQGRPFRRAWFSN